MPRISVIIPCFNDGKYIEEALASLQLERNQGKLEVIIVNDGSTDGLTLDTLNRIRGRGISVIEQVNQGPAVARSTGIRQAAGDYILPLDSDNKIDPDVFLRLASLMDADRSIDVCYTNARYFGNKESEWTVGEIDIERILDENYVDNCALIRKTVFDRLGLYDGKIPYFGHEDWEFWVRLLAAGCKFHYEKTVGYYYRVRKDSLVRHFDEKKKAADKAYILNKHYEQLRQPLINSLIVAQASAKKQRYFERNPLKAALKTYAKRLKRLFGK